MKYIIYSTLMAFLILNTSSFLFTQSDSLSSNNLNDGLNFNKNALYEGFNPHNISFHLGYFSLATDRSKEYFTSPVWLSFLYNYAPGWISNLSFEGRIELSNIFLQNHTSSYFSLINTALAVKYNYPLGKMLDLYLYAGGGVYFFNFHADLLNKDNYSYNGSYQFGGGFDIHLDYNHHISLGVTSQNLYDQELPLEGLIFNVGYQYRFGDDPSLKTDNVISINKITINNIFSSIYKYYSKNAIGTVRLTNISDKSVYDVKIQVYVNDYMDFPTDSNQYKEIKSKEALIIPIFAVFNNKVLNITEDTPQAVKIKIIYKYEDLEKEKIYYEQFRLYNRNAMTWDITEKIASFITIKDPTVKVIASYIKQKVGNGFTNNYNENMQIAMAMFEMLTISGVVYSVDPATPFEQYSKNSSMVDYIQYPRDTLRYKTGDCDDLVVLYCALLEAVGIETAFVTIPGHIFMMFNTEISKEDYKLIHPNAKFVYIINEEVWIPLEITMVGKHFYDSWSKASEEVDKYKDNLTIFNVTQTREAWRIYNPVTLNLQQWEPELPSYSSILKYCFEQYNYIKNTVFADEEKKLDFNLSNNPKDVNAMIDLGVYYAKQKNYEKALELFFKVLNVEPDNYPANYNIGNIKMLEGNYKEALKYFEKLKSLKPDDRNIDVIIKYINNKMNE